MSFHATGKTGMRQWGHISRWSVAFPDAISKLHNCSTHFLIVSPALLLVADLQLCNECKDGNMWLENLIRGHCIEGDRYRRNSSFSLCAVFLFSASRDLLQLCLRWASLRWVAAPDSASGKERCDVGFLLDLFTKLSPVNNRKSRKKSSTEFLFWRRKIPTNQPVEQIQACPQSSYCAGWLLRRKYNRVWGINSSFHWEKVVTWQELLRKKLMGSPCLEQRKKWWY